MMERVEAFDERFYQDRGLALPRAELWPESCHALERGLLEASEEHAALVFVGAGLHLAPGAIGERGFEVVRLERCDRLMQLDEVSGLARAEAGIRWGQLQAQLLERGFGLSSYGLHPAGATLGGLLARQQPSPRAMWSQELREGVVALKALGAQGFYRYLPAPRKSSGPDLRYLFIGGQGAMGVILDATLAVSPLQGASGWAIEATTLAQATEAWRWVLGLGARVGWSAWSKARGRLFVATYLPHYVRKAQDDAARARFGARLELVHGEQVEQLRISLEREHPDSRLNERAARTFKAIIGLEALEAYAAQLDEVATDLEVMPWTEHHVTLYASFERGQGQDLAPEWLRSSLIWGQPLLGSGKAQTWSSWSQRLKAQLDPQRRFAVGP